LALLKWFVFDQFLTIGKNGINIIRKIFGVILLAVALKLFITNIKAFF
jgi:multiple antibiotic resistance protein